MTRVQRLIVGLASTLVFAAPVAAADQPQAAIRNLSPAQVKQMAQAAVLRPIPVSPCACLKPYVDYCKQSNNDKWYWLGYTLTSNNSTNNTKVVVGYAEGGLYWDAAKGVLTSINVGQGDNQFFSDRRYGGSGLYTGVNPFDPAKADKVTLTLNPSNCQMQLTLKSWGNAVTNVPLQCQNGLLYGFGAGPTVYTIAIQKNVVDVPK